MRTNLYAHTEAHHPYPAFVSVNREEDGRVLMTVRERDSMSQERVGLDAVAGYLAARLLG